jgi:hypothetical protein
MREIAAGRVTDLSGSGRGDVHARTVRLCTMLDELPDGDVRLIVEHALDPARWATDASATPDLARHDLERLRREALHMLDEADEDVALSKLVEDLRARIATREPIGHEERPGVEIVTLWARRA